MHGTRTLTPPILTLSAAAWLLAAPAYAADCRDEALQMAQQYRLSLSPTGPSAGSAGTAAEAPATTESRGLTAGPDSLTSSGGTLPPSTSAPAVGLRNAAPTQPGAADRAKIEGLLSEARAAGEQGRVDECRQRLDDAQSILHQGGR